MSDEGSTGGDVWVVPASGGEARNLTPGTWWSARALFWQPDGEILFDRVRGRRRRRRDDRHRRRKARRALGGRRSARPFRAGQARRGLRRHPELVRPAAGGLRRTSRRVEAPVVAQRVREAILGRRRRACTGTATARASRAGCSIRSASTPSKRYPMVDRRPRRPLVRSRASDWPDRWNGVLPSQGYFVFLPNPRGSYGFGEAFMQGNVKDFGGGDLRDILSGVDAALKAAPIDGKRARHHRLELRRLHGDVGRDADAPLRRGRRRRRHRELAELLRPEQDRHLDAAVLRRLRLRRSEGLREVLADRVHQEREDADARPARRPRLRGPDAAGLRVLARAEGARTSRRSS